LAGSTAISPNSPFFSLWPDQLKHISNCPYFQFFTSRCFVAGHFNN
jgi:hypothetical protein